jgi:hypothetical protein
MRECWYDCVEEVHRRAKVKQQPTCAVAVDSNGRSPSPPVDSAARLTPGDVGRHAAVTL